MAVNNRYRNGEQVVERWDEVFTTLSAEPRRQIIVSLMEKRVDEPVELPEMATNPNVPTAPETLRTELHHQHLPLLEEKGFVEWETDPLVAYQGPKYDEAAAVLEALHDHTGDLPDLLDIDWQQTDAESRSDA